MPRGGCSSCPEAFYEIRGVYMLTYVTRRLLSLIPVFLGVSVIVFSMVHMPEGDPIYMFVSPQASPEHIARIRHELGFDRPLYVQYLIFMKNLLTGHLGRSIVQHKPILSLIKERLPNTLALCGTALVLSYLIAIPLGMIAATKRGSLIDSFITILAVGGIAIPQFWLGLMLLWVFAVKLHWFPAMGSGGVKHLVLPVITLSGYYVSLAVRTMRSSTLNALGQDYVTTARSKGLSERVVIYKHVLRNSIIPVITLFGMELGWLIGGAVVVEVVFSRPGLGRLLVDSIYARDYPVVQIIVLALVVAIMLGDLLADVLYGLVDPRIRYT